MRVDNETSDELVLKEIGGRLRAARLRRNLSQQSLADDAGVGRVTVQRIEDGEASSTASLIRVLRSLRLLEGVEALVPGQEVSPVELVRRRGRPRVRAGVKRVGPEKPAPIERWGDEEEPQE